MYRGKWQNGRMNGKGCMWVRGGGVEKIWGLFREGRVEGIATVVMESGGRVRGKF